jgi:uncharacterized membrane protein
MSRKQFFNHSIVLVLFASLSIIVFSIVNNGIHLMLAWNAFLAFVPIGFIYLFDHHQNKKNLKWILFIGWMFFYPNSLYLITDLIYINQDTFMQDQGMYLGLIYLQDFKAYLGFFHIFLGAMYGVMTALVSFKYFYKYFNENHKKIKLYFFFGIPVVVSTAIYIGRFLRFNSWDVLNPYAIIVELINSFSIFNLFYILLFTIIQYVLFGGYLLQSKKLL